MTRPRSEGSHRQASRGPESHDVALGLTDGFTDVLADRTRRSIYQHVKRAHVPVSVNDVADAFSMHRNAAKFHLDKLLSAGLLRAEFRRINGRRGPGAGRPSKLYSPTDVEVSISLPERHYEVLAELLLRALVSHTSLSEVGYAFGSELALRTTLEHPGLAADKVECVRTILDQLGFEPTVEVEAGGAMWITTENCPFRKVAMDAPGTEVCVLDHAIIRGILEGIGGQNVKVTERMSMPHGHDMCVREIASTGV